MATFCVRTEDGKEVKFKDGYETLEALGKVFVQKDSWLSRLKEAGEIQVGDINFKMVEEEEKEEGE